jgi:hypothetical protein
MAGEGFALKKKGPSAGTVLANGIPVRHYPPHRKDLAIQYATDPAFRALLVMYALEARRRPPVASASR